MKSCIVRRSTAALSAFAELSLLAGCQDDRVKQLDLGITRDSVMSVTAQHTTGADSMPSIYDRDVYVIDGKMLEVLYFDSKNSKRATDSTVSKRSLTPLVLSNGRLIGKGWAAWDSVAASHKIPVPKK